MKLVDTHSHIYLDAFTDDLKEMIGRAEQSGICKILMPNIDAHSLAPMMAVEKSFPDLCHPMIGLHPTSVKKDYKEQLQKIESQLDEHHWKAIGEIGIDLYWDKAHLAEQLQAFEHQLHWAIDKSLPAVIHTRNSFNEAWTVVNKLQKGNLRGVFHCFSGDVVQGKQIVDVGFHLGIGGVLTFRNSGLAEHVKHLSLENMILETDAPYLAPVPHRGKRNEPAYIALVAEKLAEVFQKSVNEIASQTTANAFKLFNLQLNG